jgi:saccharopine dehydrogenase-like NADP-dependent oxidoreductase
MSRLLVLGAGLMGPAAAAEAMAHSAVREVGLCDASQAQLDAAMGSLARRPGAAKLRPACLDLADRAAAVTLLRGHDAAVDALPARASPLAIQAALETGTPLVTLSARGAAGVPDLAADVARRGGLVVLGCGLEPGLTEILARRLAEQLDRVDELHILCGGVPERPAPPLGYKIVFGGRELPLREAPAPAVVDGRLVTVPRYSGVEPVSFPEVGELEAWHEGFAASLLEVPALRRLRAGTQKTVRWPGYAEKVSILRDLGLLADTPVIVDGAPVVPKRVLDAVLYPRVRLEPGERDLALVRVVALGVREGRPRRVAAEMVDRAADGFTAMARTTCFPASIVARMIAGGRVTARGLLRPEAVVAGADVDHLLSELRAHGIRVELVEESPGAASGAPPAAPGPAR